MMSNYQSDDIHDSLKQNLIDPPNFDIYDQFNHPRLSQIPDAESNVVSKDNLLDSEQSKTDTRGCPHPVNDVDSNPSKSSHEHSVDTRELSNIAESLTFPKQIAPNKVCNLLRTVRIHMIKDKNTTLNVLKVFNC